MLVRLEKARDGGLMARDGRKVGFPDRKFSVENLKPGDEINIEITGHNPKETVFFWRWLKDEGSEKVEEIKVNNYFSRPASHLQLVISFQDDLGVKRERIEKVYSIEDAIKFSVHDTDEWHSLIEHRQSSAPKQVLKAVSLEDLQKSESEKEELEQRRNAAMSEELPPIQSLYSNSLGIKATITGEAPRDNQIFASVVLHCECGLDVRVSCRGNRVTETLEERHPEFRDLVRKTTYRFLRLEVNSQCECGKEYRYVTTSPTLSSNGQFYRERIEGSDMWDRP